MKPSFLYSVLPLGAVALLILGAAGCGRDSVKVYHVDNQDATTPPPPPVVAPGAMPSTMADGLPTPDNSGLPSLQYTPPAGWEKKAPSQMRVASFGVSQEGKQADVSVIPLGGLAGTDLANVNRWRGQVGLGALPEADLAGLAEKVTVGAQPADLYDLAGTAPGSGSADRILAVILRRDDMSWFFKMTGDSGLVEQQKPAFIAFLKSVSFGPPVAAPSEMDMSQLPPSHPAVPGLTTSGTAPTSGEAAGQPAWAVPADWKPGPLEQFLVAKFIIQGSANSQATVNVSQLTGNGGGFTANVNRWRGQIGLPPVESSGAGMPIETFEAGGGKASLVDFTGASAATGGKTRLIGVVLPLGDQTWFYKLMGDADVVGRQKDALVKFVQSAKYPDAH